MDVREAWKSVERKSECGRQCGEEEKEEAAAACARVLYTYIRTNFNMRKKKRI